MAIQMRRGAYAEFDPLKNESWRMGGIDRLRHEKTADMDVFRTRNS